MDIDQNYRVHQESLLERSLLWTTQGFIGIGNRHLRPGDHIVIFDGDTTAFLLRRVPLVDGVERDVFEIVGDCYVYGLMGETQSDYAPLYAELPRTKDGIHGRTDKSPSDRSRARVYPVTGRTLVPRMFVIR